MFAYQGASGAWIPGYLTREAAKRAGINAGLRYFKTAEFNDLNPGYFARFSVDEVLQSILTALACKTGRERVVEQGQAISTLLKVAESRPSFLEEPTREWEKKIDLMNRLEAAVSTWICESALDFGAPFMQGAVFVHDVAAGTDEPEI